MLILSREQFDNVFPDEKNSDNETSKALELKPALQVYKVVSRFLIVYKSDKDQGRVEKLCRYV